LSADPFNVGFPVARTLKKLTIAWSFMSDDEEGVKELVESFKLIPAENEVEIRNNFPARIYGQCGLDGLAEFLESLRPVHDCLKERNIFFSFREEIVFLDLDFTRYYTTPRGVWAAELSEQEDTVSRLDLRVLSNTNGIVFSLKLMKRYYRWHKEMMGPCDYDSDAYDGDDDINVELAAQMGWSDGEQSGGSDVSYF
jgi:hypothetical protein